MVQICIDIPNIQSLKLTTDNNTKSIISNAFLIRFLLRSLQSCETYKPRNNLATLMSSAGTSHKSNLLL